MKKTLTTFSLFFAICTFNFTPLNAQTYFSDNFETGFSNWIVSGNNWDTLSSTYNSLNHCMTDSRIGNYTYNSDPTITMSSVLNLSNSTTPVLTFYHKYSLYNGNNFDYAIVEISTNGGFNWSTLTQWTNINNAWTYEQYNLSNYKFNNVKIRFHLSSHNTGSGTADGWYVDDVFIREVSIINPTLSLPFSDNFETGLGKWIRGAFNWDTLSSSYVSPTHCITDSRIGNYVYNSNSIITMNGILNLANTTLPVLTFWNKYSLYNGNNYDFATVEISTNGGFNWSTLAQWGNTNNAWTYEQFNLSNYRFNNVKIRFHLNIHNTGGGTADGWYIDDVSIRDMTSGVVNISNIIPDRYSLKQNFPNPFNPSTNIIFDIPKSSIVNLKVFDMLGRESATLVNERLAPGIYSTDWNASGYPSGVYFYKLQTEGYSEVKRMILTK